MITYCITCKTDTETGDIVYTSTKIGRHMAKGKCIARGTVKCQCAKAPTEGGNFSRALSTIISKFKLPL
jgi:hypothetical protein